jgi:hypothetical protein
MKRDRRHDEIVIASIVNEFRWSRPIYGWKRPIPAMRDSSPEACRRIMPRLEAEYGGRLVREAWRRWRRWRRECDVAEARLLHCCGDDSLNDDELSSDARSEHQAAVRHALRWLPRDRDPLEGE